MQFKSPEVFDRLIAAGEQAGRVNAVIPTPNGNVSNLCFGGQNFDVLFATCGDRVYKRKVKARGAPSFLPPRKPAPPRL